MKDISSITQQSTLMVHLAIYAHWCNNITDFLAGEGITTSCLIQLKSVEQKGAHDLYCKPSQDPITGENMDPSRETTTVILMMRYSSEGLLNVYSYSPGKHRPCPSLEKHFYSSGWSLIRTQA